MAHSPFLMLCSDCNVWRSTVIALNNFIYYSHCQVVPLFQLKSLLIKAFTIVISKHIVYPCVRLKYSVGLGSYSYSSNATAIHSVIVVSNTQPSNWEADTLYYWAIAQSQLTTKRVNWHVLTFVWCDSLKKSEVWIWLPSAKRLRTAGLEE